MKKYKMNEKFEEYTEEEMIERYGFIPGFMIAITILKKKIIINQLKKRNVK